MEEENELFLIIPDDCQDMDIKDRKGRENFFFTMWQYVLDRWKIVIILIFIISNFQLHDYYIPGHSVFQQKKIGFLKWLVNFSNCIFLHATNRSGTQLINCNNPENRWPCFNYLVMFLSIAGYFDKNGTFIKLENCENYCRINHFYFLNIFNVV